MRLLPTPSERADNGMIALTAALQRNSTLRNLNLACNSINEVSECPGLLWPHYTAQCPPAAEAPIEIGSRSLRHVYQPS